VLFVHFVCEIKVREHRKGNQKWKTRETANIGYTRRKKKQKKHNPIYVVHHYRQANTLTKI